jgi:hypothetical protein
VKPFKGRSEYNGMQGTDVLLDTQTARTEHL